MDMDSEADRTERDETQDPVEETPDPLDVTAVTPALERDLLLPLEGVVQGQALALRQLAVTLLAGGHALVEGVPGTGKTLAVLITDSAQVFKMSDSL